jgi:hypothetical protein
LSSRANRSEVVVSLFLILLVTAVFFASAFGSCRERVFDDRRDPCEDQAPMECLPETIEQADSSNFVRYRYCACMTVDGMALGYIAAEER